MRVYVSSTFQDLREHRQAVASTLRKMGHIPVAMEDYVAEGARPVDRCLDDVARCDAFVGVLAWQYGYVPVKETFPAGLTLPAGAVAGTTSITELEYWQAVANDRAPLMFLLDPEVPWPAKRFDALGGPGAGPTPGERIRAFRDCVSADHVVAFFRTPDDLASLVAAAIYRREMDQRITLESIRSTALLDDFAATEALETSGLPAIRDRIAAAGADRGITVDIGQTWWSTRLYLLAALAEDLTDARVLLFVALLPGVAAGRGAAALAAPASAAPAAAPAKEPRAFVGMAAPGLVRDRLARRSPALQAYEREVGSAPRAGDLRAEVDRRIALWRMVMEQERGESQVKELVGKQELERWFGISLVTNGVHWDARDPTALQLQRVMDYPWPYVPVIEADGFRVVDRSTFAEQAARLFIAEQVARLRTALR